MRRLHPRRLRCPHWATGAGRAQFYRQCQRPLQAHYGQPRELPEDSAKSRSRPGQSACNRLFVGHTHLLLGWGLPQGPRESLEGRFEPSPKRLQGAARSARFLKVRMKKHIFLISIIFTLVAGISAQTLNRKYEVTFFAPPPPGQDIWNRPRSVAADGKGSIFVIRPSGPPSASVEQTPVLVYNRVGELQKSWGDHLFPDAHSIDFDYEGFLWIADCDTHMVYKYTRDGKQLMALGRKGVAGDNNSTDAFNGPADVVVTRNGDFFVADGHYNSRVIHFSKDGKFLNAWGTKGPGPGQFDVPHAIAMDSKGRLLVADEQPM